jgi:Flp pilus assembly protein TadD
MTRLATPLIVLLLCGTALAGCASDNVGGIGDLFSHKKAASASDAAPSEAGAQTVDVASSVRDAQQKRLAGHYDEAIGILSQVMLVASDDPRVIGEYGKTLAENGRAQDAVQFLTRATELQPNDWSYYSALGVAYDQVGDQASARLAYEHALQLKPGEPSTLNNYALSRMLANDPAMARELIARAQAAGGGSDPKIARNIALVNNLAPKPEAAAVEHTAAAPDHSAASTPVATPMPVTSSPLQPTARNVPAPQAPLAPASHVVMQAVPVDPLAGPVKSATHAPTPLVSHAPAKIDEPAAKINASAAKTDAKTAAVKSGATAVKADAKTASAKPDMSAPKLDTKTAVAKVDLTAVKADAKTAAAKPDVKAVNAGSAPAKMDGKEAKAADAKPGAKPEAKPASKNAIPDLRQTASAY